MNTRTLIVGVGNILMQDDGVGVHLVNRFRREFPDFDVLGAGNLNLSLLWEMQNVIITPHIGGMSDIYTEQALPVFEENLERFLNGERKDLINLIER